MQKSDRGLQLDVHAAKMLLHGHRLYQSTVSQDRTAAPLPAPNSSARSLTHQGGPTTDETLGQPLSYHRPLGFGFTSQLQKTARLARF